MVPYENHNDMMHKFHGLEEKSASQTEAITWSHPMHSESSTYKTFGLGDFAPNSPVDQPYLKESEVSHARLRVLSQAWDRTESFPEVRTIQKIDGEELLQKVVFLLRTRANSAFWLNLLFFAIYF